MQTDAQIWLHAIAVYYELAVEDTEWEVVLRPLLRHLLIDLRGKHKTLRRRLPDR